MKLTEYNAHLAKALNGSIEDAKHRLASGVCQEISQVNKIVGQVEFAKAIASSLDNLLKEFVALKDNASVPIDTPIHTIEAQ